MIVKESLSDRILERSIVIFMSLWALLTLVPMLSVLAISFSSKGAVETNQVMLLPVDFAMDSWKKLFQDKTLWIAVRNTAVATAVGTVLSLTITTLMAYPLSKKEFRIGKYVMLFTILTMIFNAPIVPYFLTIKKLGLLNNPLVLVVPHLFGAYNMSIMRTFFRQIPDEMEEASRLDGCNPFQTLFYVVIPNSKAVYATLGLFSGVGLWNQYRTPLMFINKTALFPLQLKIRQIVQGGSAILEDVLLDTNNFNADTLSAAAVVFSMIPIICVYPFLQKYFVKGAMLGSVKG